MSRSPKPGFGLQPGTRYTKNGMSADIDLVRNGWVYVRLWPKDVKSQPLFSYLIRMPVDKFCKQVQGAKIEAINQPSKPPNQHEKD